MRSIKKSLFLKYSVAVIAGVIVLGPGDPVRADINFLGNTVFSNRAIKFPFSDYFARDHKNEKKNDEKNSFFKARAQIELESQKGEIDIENEAQKGQEEQVGTTSTTSHATSSPGAGVVTPQKPPPSSTSAPKPEPTLPNQPQEEVMSPELPLTGADLKTPLSGVTPNSVYYNIYATDMLSSRLTTLLYSIAALMAFVGILLVSGFPGYVRERMKNVTVLKRGRMYYERNSEIKS